MMASLSIAWTAALLTGFFTSWAVLQLPYGLARTLQLGLLASLFIGLFSLGLYRMGRSGLVPVSLCALLLALPSRGGFSLLGLSIALGLTAALLGASALRGLALTERQRPALAPVLIGLFLFQLLCSTESPGLAARAFAAFQCLALALEVALRLLHTGLALRIASLIPLAMICREALPQILSP